MANKILASSLDNFMIFNTPTIALPYVTFTVGSLSSNIEITIKEANNDYGYSRVIKGEPSGETTSTSFNTTGLGLYNLYECIKLNSIFYNITFTNATTIKCYIDTSLKYNISLTKGSGITIGGTYSSYSPSLPNKTCIILQESGATNSINMEKYHNASTISFNITSPFQKTMFNKPLNYTIMGYKITNGAASNITIPYDSITVMPTTLSKFQYVDYNDYLYTGSTKTKFLTTQDRRYYNYGEWVGLSFLSSVDLANPCLKKNFYTNSGVFLETEWTTQYVEKNGKRIDIYDTFELGDIESVHNKQVGYILVYLVNGNGSDTALTDPIRFDINPHCDGNNEIFFLNELGGIDSFNFTSTKQVARSIGEQNTYSKTHTRNYVSVFDHEYVMNKRNKITTTLATNQIDVGIANWLNQLVKSKYVFKFLGMTNPMYKIIVVDKFDVTTKTSEDEFELSLEYHDADNDTII